MRAALWLLALFGVAVAAALFAGNNQGTVTLHGRVLAAEADATCACVRAVAGVNEVVNLMTTVDSPDALNESTNVAAMNTTL